MGSSSLLNHKELQMLRDDVSQSWRPWGSRCCVSCQLMYDGGHAARYARPMAADPHAKTTTPWRTGLASHVRACAKRLQACVNVAPCFMVSVLQRALGTKQPTADPAHVAAQARSSTTAPPAADPLSESSAAELLAPRVSHSSSAAARSDLPAHLPAPGVVVAGAAAEAVQLPQKPVLVDWPVLLRVMKIWQIWVLAWSESIKSEQRASQHLISYS
jgi:hypothetical protein